MPGESVLIVDDAPVNLKLADILLRKEGFRVQTARDAAEALSALGDFQPDLMLVSAQLPGMDGLELARCVKSDPGTRHIVVVALTASSSPADREQAEEAGCAGSIAKPLDPQRLGTQVRTYLERRPSTSAGGQAALLQAGWLALNDPELETLRRRFLEEAGQQARGMLERAASAIDFPGASALLQRWAAVAGALGYSGISRAARAAEGIPGPGQAESGKVAGNCQQSPDGPLRTSRSRHRSAARFGGQDALRKTRGAGGLRTRRRGPPVRRPEPRRGPPQALRGGRLPGLWAGERLQPGDGAGTKGHNGLPLAGPGLARAAGQPLLLVGGRTDILALSQEALGRAGEFLIDGWQAEEALMRCCFALLRAAAAAAPPVTATSAPAAAAQSATVPPQRADRPEVLIADDDPIVRSLLRGTLENYGMECRMASTGPDALESIRQKLPDAAVLDINMPGMDGYLVLAAIREQGLRVPVLLLTARCHENDISRGFNLGADDYLVKPFNNVELIARLKRLLRR